MQPWNRGSVTLRYELPDGQFADSHAVAGWCHRCREVCDFEYLPDVEELRGDLARAEQAIRGNVWERLGKAFGLSPSKRQRNAARTADRTRVKLAWMLDRESAPRCLRCGGVRQAASDALRHSCGGSLEVAFEEPMRMRISFVPKRHVLSSEGLLLRTERDDGSDDVLEDFVSGFK